MAIKKKAPEDKKTMKSIAEAKMDHGKTFKSTRVMLKELHR